MGGADWEVCQSGSSDGAQDDMYEMDCDEMAGGAPASYGLPGCAAACNVMGGQERSESGNAVLRRLSRQALERAATVPTTLVGAPAASGPSCMKPSKRPNPPSGALTLRHGGMLIHNSNPFHWMQELAHKLEGVGKKFLEEQQWGEEEGSSPPDESRLAIELRGVGAVPMCITRHHPPHVPSHHDTHF